eukprot:1707197-Alexandrium_andersonii.AAC.1
MVTLLGSWTGRPQALLQLDPAGPSRPTWGLPRRRQDAPRETPPAPLLMGLRPSWIRSGPSPGLGAPSGGGNAPS